MDATNYIDLETDISQRSEFVKYFFERLDDVMWVLGNFCERADWLMMRECRNSELVAEIQIAATEVESVLKYAVVFDQSMGQMLLLANGSKLPEEYNEICKKLQNILPRLLPYCSNEMGDMNKLLMYSEEENEPTKILNRQLLRMTESIVNNFAQVVGNLFFYIDHAYRSFEEMNDAQMKTMFDGQYMRYCKDNVQMLQEYIDDIDDNDITEAKKELKDLFSLPSLLKCYQRNAGKPHLLIKEMRQACMFEHHLIEIYAYKAKLEKLKSMKKPNTETKQENHFEIVIGDKVNIPNVTNYKPEITTQSIETPIPPIGPQNPKQLEDE